MSVNAPATGTQLTKLKSAIHWRFVKLSRVNAALADQALVSGSNFAAAILFARMMGIFEFGRFTLAWMAIEFSAALQYAMISQPMLNIGPKQSGDRAAKYYDAALIQQGLFAFTSAVVIGGGAVLASDVYPAMKSGDLVMPLALATAAHQIQFFLRRYFFSRERRYAALIIDVSRYAIQLGIICWWMFMWHDGMTPRVALWIVAGSASLAATVGATFLGRIRWDGATMRSALRHHWRFGKWLLPSALMFVVSSQVPMVVAGVVLGAVAVGALRAAATVLGLVHVVLLALENFAPSHASRVIMVRGTVAFRGYVRWLTVGVVAFTACIAIGVNVNPGYLIDLIYGNQFAGFGFLVRWYSMIYLFSSMGVVLVIEAAALESTRIIFFAYFGAAVTCLLLTYPVTRFGGMVGVMITLLLVELVRTGTLQWQLRRFHACEGLPYQSSFRHRVQPAVVEEFDVERPHL